jgi:hydroxypyruvate reductase
MAVAYLAEDPGPVSGAVVVPYGHGLSPGEALPGIEVLEAAHPVPDAGALAAAERMLAIAARAESGDRMVFLVSGGASALLEAPRRGLSLDDIQAVNREILRCGASIREINTVRRRLSRIKGGGLARAAAAAEVQVLAISDVPGDRVADIGSGPCSPDPCGDADALEVLRRYGCRVPPAVADLLSRNASPSPGGEVFSSVSEQLVACADDALAAAGRAAGALGYQPRLLGADIDQSAALLARDHARLACAELAGGQPLALISGGETTVSVPANAGRGGRNTTYLLTLMRLLEGRAGVHALAIDTDGLDGAGDHAGAWFTDSHWARATEIGLDADRCLAEADSYAFFDALGTLIRLGPTRTNVNDLRVILLRPG